MSERSRGGSPRVVIVELEEADGVASGIERIRRACDAEPSARVVAVSHDPALALPAMFAGAADFALLPRDSAWLEDVRSAEADRRERALRASAPEGHGRLLIDVPPAGLPYEEYERRIVEHALECAGWNRSRAARELAISRPRLLRKIARFGLRDPAGSGEFREIDHAADLGLDLRGPDPAAILEAAQRGLIQLLFGEAPAVAPTEEREVRIEETGHPELLKAWCECLYRLLERHSFLAIGSRVESADPGDFRARVTGAILSPATRAAASELKAVTWHGLAFEPDPDGGWSARVIFDV
jgi:SHS2 domain-containing protein